LMRASSCVAILPTAVACVSVSGGRLIASSVAPRDEILELGWFARGFGPGILCGSLAGLWLIALVVRWVRARGDEPSSPSFLTLVPMVQHS